MGRRSKSYLRSAGAREALEIKRRRIYTEETENAPRSINSLPDGVLKNVFLKAIQLSNNDNEEEEFHKAKVFIAIKGTCKHWCDICNEQNFLPEVIFRKWNRLSQKAFQLNSLTNILKEILGRGKQQIEWATKFLLQHISNYSASEKVVQTAVNLVFSNTSRKTQFSKLKNTASRKKAMENHHIMSQAISGNDEASLIQKRLQSEPLLCQSVLTEHFYKTIQRSGQYSLMPQTTQMQALTSSIIPPSPNICEQILWTTAEAEHMYIHLGGGLSTEDYKCLERSLRAANGQSQVPKYNKLMKSLERFYNEVVQSAGSKSKGWVVQDFPKLLWARICHIVEREGLELPLDEKVSVTVGEGGDSFSDSKGIIQDFKVFAISAAIRRIEVNGKEVWSDPNPQSDDNRIPMGVINKTESSTVLLEDIVPIARVMEELSKKGLNSFTIVRKLEGDLKYKKLCLQRLGTFEFCDFCKVTSTQVYNLKHKWGLEITLEDLQCWGKEKQHGQAGPPILPYDPKTQETLDPLHAKLRIVGKLIDELEKEAKTVSLKNELQDKYNVLTKEDQVIVDSYQTELEEGLEVKHQLLKKDLSTSRDTATDEDKIEVIDLKLEAATEYLDFSKPVLQNLPAYDDANDVNKFFKYIESEEKPFHCKAEPHCMFKSKCKSGIISHLKSKKKGHSKTAPPPEKEIKKLGEQQIHKCQLQKEMLLKNIETIIITGTCKNPTITLKNGKKQHAKQLQEKFQSLDKTKKDIGKFADTVSLNRQKEAKFMKEQDQDKIIKLISKVSEQVKYTPPPRDENGKLMKECKMKEQERINQNKEKKRFEDKIHEIDEKIKTNGPVAKLKNLLYARGIKKKYGGGYDGNACQKILMNEQYIWSEILSILKRSLHTAPLLNILKGYQYLNTVMSLNNFSSQTLNAINKKFSRSLTSFDDLSDDFKKSCQSWGETFTYSLPHVTISHYTHMVIYHAPELLVRDHGINIHSSSGIERSHQSMKMDIRRHLGRPPWSRTLLIRWLMRTDPQILASTPVDKYTYTCI